MIDTDKYEGLTIDDWYKMNHHDWKDVVNEHNDLLAEVKRLQNIIDGIVIHLSEITTYSFGDDNPGDGNAQWMHWRTTRQEVQDIIRSDGIEEVKWT